MKNKIILENGIVHELSQAEFLVLVQSVRLLSENASTDEQKIALDELLNLFDTVDF